MVFATAKARFLVTFQALGLLDQIFSILTAVSLGQNFCLVYG